MTRVACLRLIMPRVLLCMLAALVAPSIVAAAELPVTPAALPTAVGNPSPDWERLRVLYAGSPLPLLWYRQGAPDQPLIDSLLKAVDMAASQGLSAKRYHDRLLSDNTLSPGVRDILLSDALLRLADDLGNGMVSPQGLDSLWHMPDNRVDPLIVARRVFQTRAPLEVLTEVAPAQPEYRQLVELYRRYQVLAQHPLPPLPVNVRLEPYQQAPEVPLLRRHLRQVGDAQFDSLAQQTAPDLYDQPLVEAVKRFQSRHGLTVDGVIGPKTLAALNRPLSQRLAQIRGNLERWRWMPRQLGSRYVLVSTAGYYLALVENGKPVMELRTITGRKRWPTPSFESDLSRLTVNPSWTVPVRILHKELLPQIQADPDWLASHNMRVERYQAGQWSIVDPASVNWTNPPGNVRLQEAPGPRNSLGQLKFGMDNPFSIYLHDTPAKSLFDKPLRSFSHGCVRVQGIDTLVAYLLRDQPQMLEWLNESLAQPETRVRRLPEPIPVYLVYLTTWVDGDGRAQFRPDVYGLDAPLQAKLQSSGEQAAADRRIAVDK